MFPKKLYARIAKKSGNSLMANEKDTWYFYGSTDFIS